MPRKVPFPLLDKTKKEIERMQEMGVISRVDQPSGVLPWWLHRKQMGKFVFALI